jgi:hypothetical protein
MRDDSLAKAPALKALARESALITAHENVLLGMSEASKKSKGEGVSLFASPPRGCQPKRSTAKSLG